MKPHDCLFGASATPVPGEVCSVSAVMGLVDGTPPPVISSISATNLDSVLTALPLILQSILNAHDYPYGTSASPVTAKLTVLALSI